MKWFLMLVAALGVLTQVQAMPNLIVTSSQHEGGNGVRYFYSVSNWTTQDKEVTIYCGHKRSYCRVAVIVAFEGGLQSSAYNAVDLNTSDVEGSIELGQLLFKLNNKGAYIMPFKTSLILIGYGNLVPTCVFIEVISENSTGYISGPLTSCAPIKPPPEKCNITGYTTIDHKTLSENKLDGAKASTQLFFQCGGSIGAKVTATRTNVYGVKLRDDNSLYSDITINGKDATGGINVQGPSLDVTSTLKTLGAVAPGPFSGSTVITVAPY